MGLTVSGGVSYSQYLFARPPLHLLLKAPFRIQRKKRKGSRKFSSRGAQSLNSKSYSTLDAQAHTQENGTCCCEWSDHTACKQYQWICIRICARVFSVDEALLPSPQQYPVFRPSATVSRIGLIESHLRRCRGGPPPPWLADSPPPT